MTRFERQATLEQWRDLLSECVSLVRDLREHSSAALDRLGLSAGLDGFPRASLPENSSIAGGRAGDPTSSTAVARYEGHRQRDEVSAAVLRMIAEALDAANRLATAQEASFTARGLSGGEVFGIPRKGETWATLLGHLEHSLDRLRAIGDELYPLKGTPEQNAGRNRMTSEALDARNRLRGATSAMRQALPVRIPEPTREVCKSCGTARDVVTHFGAKPRQWITSEASCRECVERPRRVARGRAS